MIEDKFAVIGHLNCDYKDETLEVVEITLDDLVDIDLTLEAAKDWLKAANEYSEVKDGKDKLKKIVKLEEYIRTKYLFHKILTQLEGKK
jgi:hypothetical protein